MKHLYAVRERGRTHAQQTNKAAWPVVKREKGTVTVVTTLPTREAAREEARKLNNEARHA